MLITRRGLLSLVLSLTLVTLGACSSDAPVLIVDATAYDAPSPSVSPIWGDGGAIDGQAHRTWDAPQSDGGASSGSAVDSSTGTHNDTGSSLWADTSVDVGPDAGSSSQADAADDFADVATSKDGPGADAKGSGLNKPPLPTQTPKPATHGLVNHGKDLWQVLENGTLKGSCSKVEKLGSSASQADLVKCGKEAFFYEHWNTYGAPRAIVDFMQQNLPDSVGKGWKHFGMVADP